MWNNIKRLIILSIILIPNWANAENAEEGLVKCGVDRDCTVCDMFILVRDIMNYLFQLLGVVAVISVIIGGFYMVISSGDQGKYKQGVDIIKNAILGIVVTLSAFIMFNFILVGLGFQVSNIGFGGGDVESDALQFEQEGQDFSLFRVKCDSTSYFLEREVNLFGGGGTRGGTGSPVSCTTGKCALDNNIKNTINSNKYGIEGNIILSLIEAGEGCNPAIRTTCNTAGFNDRDCSCGYSQCTPDMRKRSLAAMGINETDPKKTCDIFVANLEADLHCTAWLVKQNEGSCTITDMDKVSRCYNTGGTSSCGTKDYCKRVTNYYNTCK